MGLSGRYFLSPCVSPLHALFFLAPITSECLLRKLQSVSQSSNESTHYMQLVSSPSQSACQLPRHRVSQSVIESSTSLVSSKTVSQFISIRYSLNQLIVYQSLPINQQVKHVTLFPFISQLQSREPVMRPSQRGYLCPQSEFPNSLFGVLTGKPQPCRYFFTGFVLFSSTLQYFSNDFFVVVSFFLEHNKLL